MEKDLKLVWSLEPSSLWGFYRGFILTPVFSVHLTESSPPIKIAIRIDLYPDLYHFEVRKDEINDICIKYNSSHSKKEGKSKQHVLRFSQQRHNDDIVYLQYYPCFDWHYYLQKNETIHFEFHFFDVWSRYECITFQSFWRANTFNFIFPPKGETKHLSSFDLCRGNTYQKHDIKVIIDYPKLLIYISPAMRKWNSSTFLLTHFGITTVLENELLLSEDEDCSVFQYVLPGNAGSKFIANLSILFTDTVLNYCKSYLLSKSVENERRNKKRSNSSFLCLLDDPQFKDFTLKVQSQSFPVHRSILAARSHFFKNMLTEMRENEEPCANLENIDPETLKQLLEFFYGGVSHNLNVESASKLYSATHHYQVSELKDNFRSFLTSSLDNSNACDILLLADEHNDIELKNNVFHFILKNEKEFMFSDKWLNLMKLNCQLSLDTLYSLTQMRYNKFPGTQEDGKASVKETDHISPDFLCLLENPLFSDFTLEVQSQTFPVHRSILAVRSPFFKAMFLTDMQENKNGCAVLKDIETETMQHLLDFFYGGTLHDLKVGPASRLFSAADLYQVSELKDQCSSVLFSKLDLSNACNILVLADAHQDEQVKKSVLDFMSAHEKALLFSEIWASFLTQRPYLAAEAMYVWTKRKYENELCF